jgi:uncharacterized Zn-binding protein involved in type VI secretion
MPALTRMGHVSAGHPNHGPLQPIEGSGTVFVENQPVNRAGDKWQQGHPPSPHPVAQAHGGTVFADNVEVVRIGDNLSCGDVVAQGSETVFSA